MSVESVLLDFQVNIYISIHYLNILISKHLISNMSKYLNI